MVLTSFLLETLLDGKPKWAEIRLKVKEENSVGHKKVFEREISIDRLNPTRKMLEEIDEGFKEDAEETQKVLVNMVIPAEYGQILMDYFIIIGGRFAV